MYVKAYSEKRQILCQFSLINAIFLHVFLGFFFFLSFSSAFKKIPSIATRGQAFLNRRWQLKGNSKLKTTNSLYIDIDR